jgi:hypothetical protein
VVCGILGKRKLSSGCSFSAEAQFLYLDSWEQPKFLEGFDSNIVGGREVDSKPLSAMDS